MDAPLEISLIFHSEVSRQYPDGYWHATARDSNSVEYDGDGGTPLNAMTALAEALYTELKSGDTEIAADIRARLNSEVIAHRACHKSHEILLDKARAVLNDAPGAATALRNEVTAQTEGRT